MPYDQLPSICAIHDYIGNELTHWSEPEYDRWMAVYSAAQRKAQRDGLTAEAIQEYAFNTAKTMLLDGSPEHIESAAELFASLIQVHTAGEPDAVVAAESSIFAALLSHFEEVTPDVPSDQKAPGSDRPSPAFFKRLYSKLKEGFKGDGFSEEQFHAAIRHARGHAGGQAAAHARAAKTASYYDTEVAYLPAAEIAVAPKLEKATAAVSYQRAAAVGMACGDCQFHLPHAAACRLVEGTIDSHMTCNLFVNARGLSLSEFASHDTSWRLFNDLRTAADPETLNWIPYLPKPGTYEHPKWGKISITPERNARFIENFANHVYQEQLPLDAEHLTKASGAVGWIKEMRQNTNGSVDARVEWTERGRQMLAGDAFRYVSPEWYDKWQDPATLTEYEDVATGGALTTRPFFKEGALRPLVASDFGMYAYDSDDAGRKIFTAFSPITHREDIPMPNPVTPPTLITQPVEEPKAAAERITALEAENAALKTAAESTGTALKAATDRIDAMEKDNRRKRFTEMTMGRGAETDGRAWFGETEKHVAILEALADSSGEDGEPFKTYVELQKTAAEQADKAKLFAEVGTSSSRAAVAPGSAWDRIEKMATEKRQADAALTYEQSIDKVLREQPQLYTEYQEGK